MKTLSTVLKSSNKGFFNLDESIHLSQSLFAPNLIRKDLEINKNHETNSIRE
jgi:hypothetical protein